MVLIDIETLSIQHVKLDCYFANMLFVDLKVDPIYMLYMRFEKYLYTYARLVE